MTDPLARLRRFLRELKRRKVYRVAITYVVVAAGAVQLVGVVVPASRLPGWADEFFLAVAVFGFPIAVVLAWAFEVTPDGVKRTEAAEGDPAGAGGYPWIGLAVVLLAAGGFWIATAAGGGAPSGPADAGRTTAPAGERSIAVLPFANLSGTEDARPFVNGIHDDLLTRLSNVSDLKVISRTSVLPYRESELSLPAIADSLGVRWIVEGGVQQAGDQVQVNAQLIQAEDDTHRWAETYRRRLTTENLFAVQGELTKRIARSLEAELDPEEKHRVEREPTQDLEAYRLYAEGRRLLDERTPESIREAAGLFQRALRRDSSYALAWAGIADARQLHATYASDSLPDSMAGQREAARRALELDPDLAEAHASLGFAHWSQDHDAPAAIRALTRAVRLKPSYAQAHHWLALMQLVAGQPEEARGHAALSVELNPAHPTAVSTLALTHLVLGAVDRAEIQMRRLPSGPDPGAVFRGEILLQAGRWEELRRLARRRLESEEYQVAWPAYLVMVTAAQGDTAGARGYLPAIRRAEWSPESYRAFALGLAHAALGEHDAALSAWGDVEDWWTVGATILRYMPGVYPRILGPVRADPRFEELLREVYRYWGLNPDGSLPDTVDP